MAKWITTACFLILNSVALSQIKYIAPDLRWDDARVSYLGLVNPSLGDAALTLTGYRSDGTEIGNLEVTLTRMARWEAAANTLFEGETPAWLAMDSATAVYGYLRYETTDGAGFSLVPVKHWTGNQALVSQLAPPEGVAVTELTLVNTTANSGEILAHPYRDDHFIFGFDELYGSEHIPFDTTYQKTSFDYLQAFDKFPDGLVWDRLTSEDLNFSALQHFQSNSARLASMTLPRTPFDDMFFVPLASTLNSFWNRMVLVNTHPRETQVTVTSYFDYMEPYSLTLTLAPHEKRTYNYGDTNQLALPFNPTWIKFTPHERGLTGYQIAGANDGTGLAAMGALPRPASVMVLPYTPTSTDLATEIGVINTLEKNATVYIYGFNDSGTRVARSSKILHPGESLKTDAGQWFGEKAAEVTWVRLHAHRAAISAWARVKRTGDSAHGAMAGIPGPAYKGNTFKTDFEFLEVDALLDQGWTRHYFSKRFRTEEDRRDEDIFHDTHSDPVNGQFFMESAFIADEGFSFLGYEPTPHITAPFQEELSDAVAFMSPYFEMPPEGDFYLSYEMRFFEPDLATETSQYGVAWREEGQSTWHWFGLDGHIVLKPFSYVSDCWVEVTYRVLNRFITISGWLPFETKLPDSVRGKRIQVGVVLQPH